ncbi:hypothetical protein NDU88_001077 [Pleurodeles waltl]|uniref:Uncharacterized protein n=1 Tax=Pleurodeles waltl TaxID=8319 RepID=A0AAV7NA01_PLEWA|nr:hypothetical protein NDU88_001077 [Pleurodeles waltl]
MGLQLCSMVFSGSMRELQKWQPAIVGHSRGATGPPQLPAMQQQVRVLLKGMAVLDQHVLHSTALVFQGPGHKSATMLWSDECLRVQLANRTSTAPRVTLHTKAGSVVIADTADREPSL